MKEALVRRSLQGEGDHLSTINDVPNQHLLPFLSARWLPPATYRLSTGAMNRGFSVASLLCVVSSALRAAGDETAPLALENSLIYLRRDLTPEA